MKTSKYDFTFQEFHTGRIRVKLLTFGKEGKVNTYERWVDDVELVNRIRGEGYPDYEDLQKLKRIVKGKEK